MINSRSTSFAQRLAVRETYLPELIQSNTKNFTWIYFFAVSQPSSNGNVNISNIKEGLQKEISQYADVVIFNTPEGLKIIDGSLGLIIIISNCFQAK